eukprot:TRINITY_DN29568_c0_g1_i1.p1 TRINITY_DN29568_c0_g1~~TRINITY_DN29568_c0_g1_i1.p1  ORF type:complete len:112 (+),score=2.03 TRINITY_DN29568_c0_g1_i1:1681-2016(+)
MLQEINCTINNTTDINCTNMCFTEYPKGTYAIQCHLQLNNSTLSHRLGLPQNPVTPRMDIRINTHLLNLIHALRMTAVHNLPITWIHNAKNHGALIELSSDLNLLANTRFN